MPLVGFTGSSQFTRGSRQWLLTLMVLGHQTITVPAFNICRWWKQSFAACAGSQCIDWMKTCTKSQLCEATIYMKTIYWQMLHKPRFETSGYKRAKESRSWPNIGSPWWGQLGERDEKGVSQLYSLKYIWFNLIGYWLYWLLVILVIGSPWWGQLGERDEKRVSHILFLELYKDIDLMDLDVWVDGRVTSPRNGPMDSVQVGKAVFVKKVTLPWESIPRPTPILGDKASIIVSASSKNKFNLWYQKAHCG